MHFDPGLIVAGLIVGFTVGLTGMGGGALMTPILVLVFGINPLAAVSSDIVASLVMKPIGGTVHARRGTVHMGIVKWLAMGSVPSAFIGVLILRSLGDGSDVAAKIKTLLGVALIVAVVAMIARVIVQANRREATLPVAEVPVRPFPTIAVGVLGGLIVGMTSVGSGSLMIVLLLILYPKLRTSSMVGTDLVQAIPLVASAALGHLLFGDFKLDITLMLLLGCIPGVYVGARLSARASDRVIRPAMVAVLTGTSLKLFNVATWPTVAAGVVVGLIVVAIQQYEASRGERVAAHTLDEQPTPAEESGLLTDPT